MTAITKKLKGIKWPWIGTRPGTSPTTNTAGPHLVPLPTQPPAAVSTEELIAETMQEAAQISDVHHSPADKLFLGFWVLFFYLAPIVVGYAAGIWIGDGYTGPHITAGESQGIHIISLAGELTLAGLAVTMAE